MRILASPESVEDSCPLSFVKSCRFPLDCRCFGAAGWRVSWVLGMSDELVVEVEELKGKCGQQPLCGYVTWNEWSL